MPKALVKKVDEQAKIEYRDRSELIREAVKIYLSRTEKWNRIFKAGQAAAKKMGIKSEKEINDIVYEFRHGRKP